MFFFSFFALKKKKVFLIDEKASSFWGITSNKAVK